MCEYMHKQNCMQMLSQNPFFKAFQPKLVICFYLSFSNFDTSIQIKRIISEVNFLCFGFLLAKALNKIGRLIPE